MPRAQVSQNLGHRILGAYLEVQGHLITRLITPIFPLVTYLLSPPEPPSMQPYITMQPYMNPM